MFRSSSGSTPKYSYSNIQQPPTQVPAPGPSPPYIQTLSAPVEPSSQHEIEYGPQEAPNEMSELQIPGVSQPRAPSPARRSMFDFVSPFDALANTSSTAAKRKPAPPQTNVQSNYDDPSWASASAPTDPKRRSVETLMDQLARGQAPPPAPMQHVTPTYDPYAAGDETPQAEPAQARASRPLPPQPPQPLQPSQISYGTSSPRSSPPKPQVQARQQRRSAGSPVVPPATTQGSYAPAPPRDRESPLMSGQFYRNGGQDPRFRNSSGPKKQNTSPRRVYFISHVVMSTYHVFI